jgi:pimeloyl-ACP methyl ester carboxylesterase
MVRVVTKQRSGPPTMSSCGGSLANGYAEVVRLEDAGHYLQEDAHERIVPALVEFLGR